MFSRFSKTNPPGKSGAPAGSPTAPVERTGIGSQLAAQVSQKTAAEAMAADRDKKRKELQKLAKSLYEINKSAEAARA